MNARIRYSVIALIASLVLARSLIFIIWGFAHFDADQAILGFMTRDISRLHGLVLFFYGQKYLLGILDWLAAPLFLLFGPSISALKLPLVGINIAVVYLLVRSLQLDARLKQSSSLLCALVLALPSVVIASRFVEAQGGNIEAFLSILLLWNFRRKPILGGLVAALGYLNREFVIYGVLALFIVEFPRSRIEAKLFAKNWLIAVGVALVTRRVIRMLAGSSLNYFAESAPRPIVQPLSEMAQNWDYFSSSLIPNLFGAVREPLAAFNVVSSLHAGSAFACVCLSVAILSALILIGQNPKRFLSQEAKFPIFLVIVGILSALSFVVFRSGVRDLMCVRYVLLFLFLPVGVFALAFQSTIRRRLLPLMAFGILLWSISNGVDHLRLWREYVFKTPRDEIALLKDELLEKGLHCGSAPYWTAYPLAFEGLGTLRVSSSSAVRIPEFQKAVEGCPAPKFSLTDSPGCVQAERIGRWYLCVENQ